ncbi:MAG TPA: hypothetical protein VI298_14525 [Geobacteraceae bacterium]
MKWVPVREMSRVFVTLLLLALPVIANAEEEQSPAPPAAQTEQKTAGPPPIAPELIREGDFAVKLQPVLGLGTSTDEAEAESRLGEAGIVPRNGWIADYPVTPDILGELQKSVEDAAAAGKITLGKDEALKRLNDVSTGFELAVKPHAVTKTYEALPEEAEQYPNPAVINNYYYEEGPPVVTYYAPPPDYYYLYAWVPYPFWWWGFWFPGFFVLNDFHRPIFFHNRWCFVSNHFNDVRVNRVFRIDPVSRFSGRTFAGIGVRNRSGFISTGVPRSDRRIFNGPRTWGGPGGRTSGTPSRGGRSFGTPSRGGRSFAPPAGGRSYGAPGGGRSYSPRGGRSYAPSPGGGRTGSPGGGRAMPGRGERR